MSEKLADMQSRKSKKNKNKIITGPVPNIIEGEVLAEN